MFWLMLSAAAAAVATPVVAPPPAPPVPPPPMPVRALPLVPMSPAVFRPLPQNTRISLDFTVAEDGRAVLCIARELQGRMAAFGGIPGRCPASQFEPYTDAAGKPVRQNVSMITTIVVTEVK